MSMFKKKDSKQPESNTTDFTALDSAVSELSKQTEALLGSTDSQAKVTKPKLPKKHAAVHAKAKSFDIIHDPSRKTKLKSTLKTAPKAAAQELLSASVDDESDTVAGDSQNASAAIVHAHKEGSLHSGTVVKAEQVSESAAKAEEPKLVTKISESETEEASVQLQDKAAAHNLLSFDDETKDDGKASEADPAKLPESAHDETEEAIAVVVPEVSETKIVDKTKADTTAVSKIEEEATDTKEPESSDEKETKETEIKDESDSYRGELYANNLVKEVEPKGFIKSDDSSKPAVFDTDEYHPELHDWSKLESHSGLNWLLLVLLLVVAGGVAYFVLTGQKLPF